MEGSHEAASYFSSQMMFSEVWTLSQRACSPQPLGASPITRAVRQPFLEKTKSGHLCFQ